MSNDLIQKNAELGRFLFCERYTLQPVKNALYIAEGQDLKRGAVVDVNGYLIGTEGLQPYAVLENDCDTMAKGAFASVFVKGEFNFDKLFFADGLSKEQIDNIVYNGSKVGIIIKPYNYSLDFSPKSDEYENVIPEDASEENKLATDADVAEVQSKVNTIDGVIPSGTSTTNKLVNEDGLQTAIDAASESWSTGFTPKGKSSVSDLNDLATQSNGDSYIVTDSGTLTDGSLAVVAGDQVAWDATNSVWYKLPQYALKQFGTNAIKDLATTKYKGFMALDDADGTGKMGIATIFNNFAPAFNPNRTGEGDDYYKAGEDVLYNGTLYRFKADHYGAWVAADAFAIAVGTVAASAVARSKIASDDYKKRLAPNGDLTPVNFLNPDDPDVSHGWTLAGSPIVWQRSGNTGPEWEGGDFGESGFIPVIPGERIYVYGGSGAGSNYLLYFDENKNYLSQVYLTNVVNGNVVPSKAYYVRAPFNEYQYWSGNAITAVYRVPVNPYVYHPYVKTAKEEYFVNSSDVCKLVGGPENLFNPNDPGIETGGYRIGNDNSWESNANYIESGYIPLKPGQTLHYYSERINVPADQLPNLQYCLYDENKNFVSGGSFGNTTKKYFTLKPTSSAKYIRIPVSVSNIGKLCLGYHAFTKYIPYGQRDAVLMSDVKKELGASDNPISQKAVTDALASFDPSGLGAHWTGKKWYAYGTSITDTTPTGKYLPYLATLSGMIATDKGIGGGGIGDLGGYSHGQVFAAICNTTDGKTEADLITLETGANDTGADVPLGTIYDTTQDTLAGCLNLCIRYLQANTNAQIAIMPSVATITEPNAANKYYEWAAMIEQICAINRVYFIKPACNLGYGKLTSANGTLYRVDNIHQTDLGGYVLAEAMWAQIRNIPLFRTALPTP